MLEMSRKCVPYTPVTARLSEMSIALVSSTGVYAEGQEPFGDDSDISFRIIPPETQASQLRFHHGHFPEEDAKKDPNTVFPLALLHELVARGVIKKVSNKHIGFRGFSTDLKAVYAKTAPAIADEIERSQADAVVLSAGCPMCHRVVVAAQREIESRGVPTVVVTVVPSETKIARAPRALHPVGNDLGRVFGAAGDKHSQMKVLLAALEQFEKYEVPGTIVEFTP